MANITLTCEHIIEALVTDPTLKSAMRGEVIQTIDNDMARLILNTYDYGDNYKKQLTISIRRDKR